jgi:hypothetical protein
MVSSPIDSRIKPSFTPRASRFSLGIEACVIVAGWLTKLSTPPKLSARVKTSNLLRIFFTFYIFPSVNNDTIPPNMFICFFAIS